LLPMQWDFTFQNLVQSTSVVVPDIRKKRLLIKLEANEVHSLLY
jgi:hypothetical protein